MIGREGHGRRAVTHSAGQLRVHAVAAMSHHGHSLLPLASSHGHRGSSRDAQCGTVAILVAARDFRLDVTFPTDAEALVGVTAKSTLFQMRRLDIKLHRICLASISALRIDLSCRTSGTMSSVTPLPPEMTDQIISHIGHDKNTLRVCSLVCRTWATTCQAYLFHYVGIKGFYRAEAFCKLLDTSPHIAHHVKNITMADRASFYSPFLEKTFPAISHKLPQFTNVTVLGLRHFKVSSAVLLSLTRENFATIQTLWVLFCTFNTFQDLMTLIAAYPQLEDLTLQHASVTDPGLETVESSGGTDVNLTLPSSLRRINYVGPGIHRLVQTMRTPSGAMCGVESLQISPKTREDLHGVSGLLSKLGPWLQHLSIGMSQNNSSPGVQDALVSISQSTSLRTLCFTYIRLSAASPEWIRSNEYACEWVADTLSRVRSPNMETIQIMFSISYGDSDALQHFDLGRIDTILQNGFFAKLRRVDVIPCASIQEIEKYISDIRSRMPGLNKRGVLRIS